MIDESKVQSTETVTAETAPEMGSEELAAYFAENGNAPPAEKEEEEDETGKPKEDSKSPFEKMEESQKKEGEEEEEDEKGEEKKGEEEEEFTNMVDFLNKEHDLGLNVDNLPADISREQEAEVVNDLFKRTLDGVNRKLGEYQYVEEVLKDEEVANFIKAKADGKTLKEYVTEYAQTTEGQSDKDVLKTQLSTQNSEMTAEEIEDLIKTYEDKGILDKMATSARASIKEQEETENKAKAQSDDAEYQSQVVEFGKLVKGTKSVYGIPLTDQMKNDVYIAATQRDNDGMTYMDQIVQSDEGLFLAALGVLHMQELMQAKASTSTNKAKKSLVDKLFDKASDLQSKTEDTHNEEGFNAEVANRF